MRVAAEGYTSIKYVRETHKTRKIIHMIIYFRWLAAHHQQVLAMLNGID